jgi:hypothetical protein
MSMNLLRYLLDKDLKALAQAGILDERGFLTVEGGLLLLNIVMENPEYKSRLAEIAKEINDGNSKRDKRLLDDGEE